MHLSIDCVGMLCVCGVCMCLSVCVRVGRRVCMRAHACVCCDRMQHLSNIGVLMWRRISAITSRLGMTCKGG